MSTTFRKMSYARLATLAHTPEGQAELARRRARTVVPSSHTPLQWAVDFDRYVAETVTRAKEVLLARVLTNLGLPPA